MNLKSMPVDKLMDLRNRVQAALGTKLTEARRMLQTSWRSLGVLEMASAAVAPRLEVKSRRNIAIATITLTRGLPED